MNEKRSIRKTVFAVLATLAGLVVIGIEFSRPEGETAIERWFWFIVGLLLVGLGVIELTSRAKREL